MRITIKAKLAAAFAAVLTMLGAVVWLAITSLSAANERTEELINVYHERVELSLEIQESMAQLGRAVGIVMMAQDDVGRKAGIAQAEAYNAEIEQYYNELLPLSGEGGGKILEEFEANRKRVADTLEQVFALALEATKALAAKRSHGETRDALRTAQAAADAAVTAALRNPSADPAAIRLLGAEVKMNMLNLVRRAQYTITMTDAAEIASQSEKATQSGTAMLAAVDALGAASKGYAKAEFSRLRDAVRTLSSSTVEVAALGQRNSETSGRGS